jgi:hypothetical protein
LIAATVSSVAFDSPAGGGSLAGWAETLNWSIVKLDLHKITGLPNDALHVLSGMLVLTAAAYLLRRPPWTWRPWFAVVVAETMNELYDLTQAVFPSDEGNIRASLHDFWLTLAWPTLILLLWPHFVAIEHDAGPLARLRRLWHSREFLVGFAAAVVIGLGVAIYFW